MVGSGRLRRGHDLVVGGVGAAVGDVGGDGSFEEPGVLEHHADAGAQFGAGQGGDVGAVEGDAAGCGFVEAQQQVDQGGLARAGGADDGDGLVRGDGEIQVLDQWLGRLVAEGDLLEVHPPHDLPE